MKRNKKFKKQNFEYRDDNAFEDFDDEDFRNVKDPKFLNDEFEDDDFYYNERNPYKNDRKEPNDFESEESFNRPDKKGSFDYERDPNSRREDDYQNNNVNKSNSYYEDNQNYDSRREDDYRDKRFDNKLDQDDRDDDFKRFRSYRDEDDFSKFDKKSKNKNNRDFDNIKFNENNQDYYSRREDDYRDRENRYDNDYEKPSKHKTKKGFLGFGKKQKQNNYYDDDFQYKSNEYSRDYRNDFDYDRGNNYDEYNNRPPYEEEFYSSSKKRKRNKKDRSYDNPNHYLNNGDNLYISENPYLYQKEQTKKKSMFWSIIGFVVFVIMSGTAALTAYLVIKNRVTLSGGPSITRQYMTDTSDTSNDAMKYISERTLSLNFNFVDSSSKTGRAVYGTGWIFNKEKDSNTYYIATNIHVAAALTYSGKKISDDEDFTNYKLESSFVSYTNYQGTSGSPSYESSNLMSVQTQIPEIVYLADIKTIDSSFAKGYSSSSLVSTGYENSIDFAILKYDFSSTTLEALSSRNKFLNNDFSTWLKNGYDSNPTQFLSTPISNLSSESSNLKETSINENFFTDKYYMGGYPNVGGSSSANIDWVGLSNFPIATPKGGVDSLISPSNYLKYASGMYQTKSHENSENPNKYNEENKIDYYENNNQVKYINVGLNGLFDASSIGGASGSMVIAKTTDSTLDSTRATESFKVIGIYWGSEVFSEQTQSKLVGAGSLLNVSEYKIHERNSAGVVTSTTTYPGYDIFSDATKAITSKLASGKSLQYTYTSQNSVVTNSSSDTNSSVSKNASLYLWNMLNAQGNNYSQALYSTIKNN